MRVFWILLILQGCRTADAAWSPNTCPCEVPLETICVRGGERVTVPCPNATADELTFNLFRDQRMVSNATCSRESGATKCAVANGGAEVSAGAAVTFVLAGVTERSQGTYHCEGTVTFPPPVRKVPAGKRIHVLLEGHVCKPCSDKGNRGDEPSCTLHWVWMVVIALLTIYSVTATIIAVVYWVKLRNTDSNDDYMNAKPRAQRKRRNKRKIQTPIQRHF